MKFKILSHAGMTVEGKGKTLLFDPWLIGSCYWRSWWNFPEIDREELREIEWALHTTQAAGTLSYLYTTGDARDFERTREVLLHMLDTSPAR